MSRRINQEQLATRQTTLWSTMALVCDSLGGGYVFAHQAGKPVCAIIARRLGNPEDSL
jgi:hypothetical protein